MDPNRMTEKSAEALQAAQTKALRFGHQEVDECHLLLALLEQSEGLAPRLLTKLEVRSQLAAVALAHEAGWNADCLWNSSNLAIRPPQRLS